MTVEGEIHDFSAQYFDQAYPSYYDLVESYSEEIRTILEVGGGAHPTLSDRSDVIYTIIDPDTEELEKAPADCHRINAKIQTNKGKEKYDLILSKMVLEHVENPDSFHQNVLNLLNEQGRAIHFFACKNSLPAWANRILPEGIGAILLKLLKNRDTKNHPKYPAYYRRTLGGVKKQIKYFESQGYEVLEYRSYVGHKYFKSIPVLKQLEQLYTHLLVLLNMKSLATVALVVLKKR